jgi:hypothetical protein
MATLLYFLLRLGLSYSGAALYFGLYNIDELRISFGAVKLLLIITLPDYRCRPFHRIGPTLTRRVTMTEKLQLRDAVYRLEDTIREIRNRLWTIREGSTRLPSGKARLTHCSHWQLPKNNWSYYQHALNGG